MSKIKYNPYKQSLGFTLLEILIALFIFTIVSILLVNALQNVISVQTRTEAKAERLRNLQIALLLFSRELEQSVNRPVINNTGALDPPFVGTAKELSFTHGGYASPAGLSASPTIRRTSYSLEGNEMTRTTWDVLDQVPKSRSQSRILLKNILDANFQYLDQDGLFHNSWPLARGQNLPAEQDQPLPRAVRIYLNLSGWGTISQLYVISAQASKSQTNQSGPPPPPPNP